MRGERRKPRFGGLELRSRWGLSSDLEVICNRIYELADKEGVGVVFTPTITLSKDIKAHKLAKLCVLKYEGSSYVFLSRPLSNSIRDIKQILHYHVPKVMSIAAAELGEWIQLVEMAEEAAFNAIELDFVAAKLLSSRYYHASRLLIEVANEVASVTRLPVIAKLRAYPAPSVELVDKLASIGVGAIVLTPHLTYTVGSHFFRIHSTSLSRVALSALAEFLSSEPSVQLAYITDEVWGTYTTLLRSFDLVLYDVSFLVRHVKLPQIERKRVPLSWRSIPSGAKLVVEGSEAAHIAEVCPCLAIPSKEEYGLVEVDRKCVFCGLCLDVYQGLVKYAWEPVIEEGPVQED